MRSGRTSSPRKRRPRNTSAAPPFNWYFPSWHGDLRIGRDPEDSTRTRLSIEKPTAEEQRIVNEIGRVSAERGWLAEWVEFKPQPGAVKWEFTLGATVEAVGIVVAATMRPSPDVLTNIRFDDGTEIAVSGGPKALAEAMADAGVGDAEGEPKKGKAAKVAKPMLGATVPRPTPCCPRCVPGSVAPAREVLLKFLDADQHDQWASSRTLVVEGGITGARYLLAHRDTATAARIGRICYDLDDRRVVHFHNTALPPEEDVLAALLILRHREDWLRNEATVFGPTRAPIFKNPFGDISDGTRDAALMTNLGSVFMPLFSITA